MSGLAGHLLWQTFIVAFLLPSSPLFFSSFFAQPFAPAAASKQFAELGGIQTTLQFMHVHLAKDRAASAACACLQASVKDEATRVEFFQNQGIDLVATAMEMYFEKKELILSACAVMWQALQSCGVAFRCLPVFPPPPPPPPPQLVSQMLSVSSILVTLE